jgi:hypothetical protein
MTLGALLQLLRESILNDRSDRASGSSDYLWTDETLVTFMNEAQRRFAVQGLVLRDGTTDEVTKLTLVEGVTHYPLHESVIAVLSARGIDQQADLNRVGHTTLGAYRAPSDSWVDPGAVTGLPAGPTLAFSTDDGLSDYDSDSLSQVMLRVYPAPAAAQAGTFLRLRVVRKPIEPLRATALGAAPEIPEDHHIEMLDWAAYLALRIVDDDAGAAKRALEFRATFEQHVKEARMLVMRKLFAPMEWGFGRGGFSWGN